MTLTDRIGIIIEQLTLEYAIKITENGCFICDL